MTAPSSSFTETTFGMNAGTGPNASRDVTPPAAKIGPKKGATKRKVKR